MSNPVLIREEVIDHFNYHIRGKEIGISWRYSIWEYTDGAGQKRWLEQSHGTCNLYFFSIPLIGDVRNLPHAPDPV